MPAVAPAPIVHVGYRSTNGWVVGAGDTRLLVDVGWPGTLGLFKATLNRPVFIGALPPEIYCADSPVALASRRKLRQRGAKQVYPAHGPIRAIDDAPPTDSP